MPRRLHRRLVAIAGAGHSGSTLLGLSLGSHPQLTYAGEAKKSTFLRDASKPLRKRVCKLCGPGCPVWSAVGADPEPDVYEALSRVTGRPTVVDSSKDVAWIRRMRDVIEGAGAEHRLLLLLRDGRAVLNSRLRKAPDTDPDLLIDRWMAKIAAARTLAEERPEATLALRYEDLATDPEATLRAVTAFLELPFDAAMLRYEQHEHHPLGGNTGTQSVVARAQAKTSAFADVPGRSERYYRPLTRGFHLDLRWRDELPDPIRARFERRAGAVNAPLRWEAAS